MSLSIETVPLIDLRKHPDNPRHGDVEVIAQSLRANGQYQPLVVAEDGTVLVGNHRFAAMRELGWDTASVIRVPYKPGDPEAIRIMLADNRTSDLAKMDASQVIRLLESFDDDLFGTGYQTDDMDELRALAEAQTDLSDIDTEGLSDQDIDTNADRAATTGELLTILDVAIGEPSTTTHHGQRWHLGHHLLIVCDPIKEWKLWHPDLRGDMLFCPYPDLYLPTTDKLIETPALLIQPRPYLAGHMVDKFKSAFPNEPVMCE